MRAVRAVTVVAMTLAVGGVGGAPASAAPSPADPCGRSSWLAGTTELCDGVMVYRDYVVDDYGAADPADPTNETELLGSLSRTEGDARYADGSKAGTADLVDLSVRIDGANLIAVFETNALYEPGSTIGALAIDTDNDRATGGGAWPGVDVASDGWDVVKTIASGNTSANTLTLKMPVPAGGTWRFQAVTAKADGTVMNVAFRGIDEESGLAGSAWWEGKQAQALASGDISQFGATVDVDDLRDGTTRTANHTAPGYHERVFTSAYTIGSGEGYSYEPEYGRHGDSGSVCEQEFATLGRYQPYSVYVPSGGGEKGMQLFLHGCNANHTSQIDGEGFQTQFGDDLDRVIIAPLGRGPVGYYSDISEADVFEALTDAERTYRTDPHRRFISGYSMGGYGALRLGALYPHLWAGLTNWVGFTGDATNNPTGQRPGDYPSGGIGNAIDLVRNLERIPSEHLYAGGDELVHSTSHTALALRMREEGIDHAYYLHPAAEHLTFVLIDQWRKEAEASKGRTLVANPPRVRFRTDESFDYPEYGITHDRAYWISQITSRGKGYSDVDLTTAGCGGSLPVREASNDAGENPVPWVSDELRTVDQTPIPKSNSITGSVANVASLVIDAKAACVAGDDVTYDIDSDGPVTIVLSDGRSVDVDSKGRHKGVLSADGEDTREGSGDAGTDAGDAARTLPATGGGAAVAGVLVLAFGAVLGRRRRH